MTDNEHALWPTLWAEVEELAELEQGLRAWLEAIVLSHDNVRQAIVALVADALSSSSVPLDAVAAQLSSCDVAEDVAERCLVDLTEARSRDQAASGYSGVFLFSKGFRGLASYRFAYAAWQIERYGLARFLHARAAEALAIDIHPGAALAPGIVLDHGTGFVVGETAVVGRGSYLFHGVTLGSTGRGSGHRHPKLEDDVFVGANATILGNVTVGAGSVVAAGSIVTKDVPRGVVVAGSPARVIGEAPTLLPRRDL